MAAGSSSRQGRMLLRTPNPIYLGSPRIILLAAFGRQGVPAAAFLDGGS
jgi:hypothetical protein